MTGLCILNKQFCTAFLGSNKNARRKGAGRKEEIKAKIALPLNKKLSEIFEGFSLEEFLAFVKEQITSDAQILVEQVSDNLDAIYMEQIAKAQDFVNGNAGINIYIVRELLREILPEQYGFAIKKIKSDQSVRTIINILGGNNQILPSAEKGEQHIGET